MDVTVGCLAHADSRVSFPDGMFGGHLRLACAAPEPAGREKCQVRAAVPELARARAARHALPGLCGGGPRREALPVRRSSEIHSGLYALAVRLSTRLVPSAGVGSALRGTDRRVRPGRTARRKTDSAPVQAVRACAPARRRTTRGADQ